MLVYTVITRGTKTLENYLKNLSYHTDILCELVNSLLIKGIQMEELSEMCWLIGIIKHAIWADSLVSYT
jgi:hypothetical protein